MARTSALLVMTLATICLGTAMIISGCSEAADRTLTIFQYQSDATYDGPFRIDTSALPPDAVEARTDNGETSGPATRITLNMDYEIEVVLRLAGTEKSLDKANGKPSSDVALD
jgi:hypothetical protein